MPAHDDEFEQIIQGLNPRRRCDRHSEDPVEIIDENPYGAPAQHHKAGLTKRGKAALGIGAAVIAGSGLIGYQAYAADAAEHEAKVQELAVKSQELELEKLREMNRASENNRKATADETKARQASVDTCVKSHSDQVGKGFGSPSRRDVIDDCQAQYLGTTDGDGMEPAASSQAAGDAGGGDVNQGFLIGGGVLALFLVAAAKKGKRTNPA